MWQNQLIRMVSPIRERGVMMSEGNRCPETVFSFHIPSDVVFGDGEVERLPGIIRGLGSHHPLVLTGRTLCRTEVFRSIRGILDSSGIRYGVYDRIEPEPPVESVGAAVDLARSGGHDLMIGVGGGSTMDFTKAAAVIAPGGMDILDLVGRDRIIRKGLPTIMIPTTSGSGSEVSPVAIFTFAEEKVKKGIVSPHITPDAAIVDPELTHGLPPRVTADTGMDALIHAVESFLSVNANLLSETLSLAAVGHIAGSLEKAVKNGCDAAARRMMSLGSLMAGMAFAMAGTAAVHALAYPLGGEFHVPHGAANTVMLRQVMEFNLEGNSVKFARLARSMSDDAENIPDTDAAFLSIDRMTELARNIGVVTRIRDLGVPVSAIPGMAEAASKETRLLSNNPRPMNKKQIEEIYRKAW